MSYLISVFRVKRSWHSTVVQATEFAAPGLMYLLFCSDIEIKMTSFIQCARTPPDATSSQNRTKNLTRSRLVLLRLTILIGIWPDFYSLAFKQPPKLCLGLPQICIPIGCLVDQSAKDQSLPALPFTYARRFVSGMNVASAT
ncbi:hypothetical protein CSKR_106325 [Clonorchis sinensis]|uniref:Uncharacterized protein n=1 Tax=Clonorchis sinensis TaxID=79923 RepID=A0A419Q2C1_CLOSI|nr:hypothetical protein CSKR_106325 [Clonorchis sinensis]